MRPDAARPDAAHQYPKQLVEWPQPWPGMFAFQDSKLLPESEVFQHQAATAPKDAKYSPGTQSKKVEHGGNVIADRIVGPALDLVDFKPGQHSDNAQVSPVGR